MSTSQVDSQSAPEVARGRNVEMKLEVVLVPVSDVDRAKRFYEMLGWRLDADFATREDFRVVQFTPPGSEASIIFGEGVTSAVPGSVEGLQLTVFDIDAARAELVDRGVEVSEIFHDVGGVFHHAGTEGRAAGPAPEHAGLWLLRRVQRSRRQRLAAPRGQDTGARTMTSARQTEVEED